MELLIASDRQPDGEDRPARGIVAGLDCPAVRDNNLLRDPQPDSAACRLGCIVRFENGIQPLLRDAQPTVADLDENPISRQFGPNLNAALMPDGLQGVDYEIEQRLNN